MMLFEMSLWCFIFIFIIIIFLVQFYLPVQGGQINLLSAGPAGWLNFAELSLRRQEPVQIVLLNYFLIHYTVIISYSFLLHF